MKTKVLLISGHAQHGKDTLAVYAREELERREKTAVIIHYGDLLKYICKEYFNWDCRKDDYGRSLLQFIGTSIVREQKPNYWVDFVSGFLEIFDGVWDFAIIPDVRFPNEIMGITNKGFEATHIRIDRMGFDNGLTQEQKGHISETALNGVNPDYTVKNDRTLETLNKKTIKLIEEILTNGEAHKRVL